MHFPYNAHFPGSFSEHVWDVWDWLGISFVVVGGVVASQDFSWNIQNAANPMKTYENARRPDLNWSRSSAAPEMSSTQHAVALFQTSGASGLGKYPVHPDPHSGLKICQKHNFLATIPRE